MRIFQTLLAGIVSLICITTANAQLTQRIKPFSMHLFGVTITGTYSEGYLERQHINGTNILFGLITWGGSETINCKPGSGICRIETVLNFQFRGLTRDRSGQVGFEKIPVAPGREPVVVGVNDEGITFAVDLTQVPATRLTSYASRDFVLEREFILPPDIVRNLGLYKGSGQMGYIVPKGRYPLYRDGNIVYWTFNPKQALK